MEGEVKEGEPHRTGSGDGDINASVRSPRAPQPSLPPIISSSLSLEALPPFPSFTLPPSFASSSTLLKQGAEGRVFLSTFLSRPCVVKQRFPKTYRHPSLDLSLTRARLNAECRSLLKVRRAGVDTPTIYWVSDVERLIVMELIHGCTVREWMQRVERKERETAQDEVGRMMRAIGRTVAAVHAAGVIHGDLTTSNLLVKDDLHSDGDGIPTLVSSGASSRYMMLCGSMVEDRAVDLYVLERAFLSTHPNSQDEFEVVLNAYLVGLKDGSKVLQKLHHVRQRGRKRQMIG